MTRRSRQDRHPREIPASPDRSGKNRGNPPCGLTAWPSQAGTLKEVPYRMGKTGAPILEQAIGSFECEVREISNEQGDHAVVIGEVVEASVREDAPALTLMDTGWHYGG